jgi:hypothetical protein
MTSRRSRTTRIGLSWIASSGREIANTRTLLNSLKQQNTLDELGFLRLFGGFAESFYPATTTIMTRARYLVFLPAIFRHIADRGLVGGRDPDRVSRDWQDKLRKILAQNEPARGAGVIGKEARRNLARTPSIIYWSGLTSLGIGTRPLSEARYVESLSEPTKGASIRDDDGSMHDIDNDAFWDPSFRTSGITVNGDVTPTLNFSLTYREARAIQERFDRIEPDQHRTLLTECVHRWAKDPDAHADPAYPWVIPGLPDRLGTTVKHAEALSLLSQGATLLYHAALFKKRRLVGDACSKAFEVWYRLSLGKLSHWDLDEFTSLRPVIRSEAVIDVPFLRALRKRLVAVGDSVRAYNDPEIHEIIAQRERQTRGVKARLNGGHYLRLWKPRPEYPEKQIYGLEFRHAVGMRFARDIANGLARPKQ